MTAKPSYSFERDSGLSFDGSLREIEDFYEASPAPDKAEIFDRLSWRYARLRADEPDAIGAWAVGHVDRRGHHRGAGRADRPPPR